MFIGFLMCIFVSLSVSALADDDSKNFYTKQRLTNAIEKGVKGIDGVAFVMTTSGGYTLCVTKGKLFTWEEVGPKIREYLCLEGYCSKIKIEPPKAEVITPLEDEKYDCTCDGQSRLLRDLVNDPDVVAVKSFESESTTPGPYLIIKKGTGCVSYGSFEWCSEGNKCGD